MGPLYYLLQPVLILVLIWVLLLLMLLLLLLFQPLLPHQSLLFVVYLVLWESFVRVTRMEVTPVATRSGENKFVEKVIRGFLM